MRERLRELLNNSYSPYSNFKVAAILVTKEGLELKKVNVKNYLDAMELKGASLRFEQEKVFKSIKFS